MLPWKPELWIYGNLHFNLRHVLHQKHVVVIWASGTSFSYITHSTCHNTVLSQPNSRIHTGTESVLLDREYLVAYIMLRSYHGSDSSSQHATSELYHQMPAGMLKFCTVAPQDNVHSYASDVYDLLFLPVGISLFHNTKITVLLIVFISRHSFHIQWQYPMLNLQQLIKGYLLEKLLHLCAKWQLYVPWTSTSPGSELRMYSYFRMGTASTSPWKH